MMNLVISQRLPSLSYVFLSGGSPMFISLITMGMFLLSTLMLQMAHCIPTDPHILC